MGSQKYDNKFHLFLGGNRTIGAPQNYNVILGILVDGSQKKR